VVDQLTVGKAVDHRRRLLQVPPGLRGAVARHVCRGKGRAERRGEQRPVVQPPRRRHRLVGPGPDSREVTTHDARRREANIENRRRPVLAAGQPVQLGDQDRAGLGVAAEQPLDRGCERDVLRPLHRVTRR
jgi:hypothetical protein